MQQGARDRVMKQFRSGTLNCLVATDVVGRGIDVSGISHIINYDIPQFCDDYVHRVGRTGRMGREGVAYTFVTPEEGSELTRIEQRINRMLMRDEIKGFDAHQPVAPVEMADAGKPSSSAPAEEQTDSGSKPPPPPYGGRSRRHRRAL
jgi:ATP-dependent RNA helicase DeaD